MKAIRLTTSGHALEEYDIPTPRPTAGEVLVRVMAAGICHSDAHYRAGRSRAAPLPLTLGHEVAGVVEEGGGGFTSGERVCVHYLATCGHCEWCSQGQEQFCPTGKMIGKHRDGGFAEYVAVPSRCLFRLPEEIPFEHGAVLMCSSATSLHALVKARLRPGETAAIIGCGGLGASAIQLAQAIGANAVFGVDLNPAKLELANRLGARPINALAGDPAGQLLEATGGRGVNAVLDLVGTPATSQAALKMLAVQGRLAIVGIGEAPFQVSAYDQLVNREAEIIGVSDHLATEIPLLLRFVQEGKLRLGGVVNRTLPLDARAINAVLDALERGSEAVRAVVMT